jgi:hypothetical protein
MSIPPATRPTHVTGIKGGQTSESARQNQATQHAPKAASTRKVAPNRRKATPKGIAQPLKYSLHGLKSMHQAFCARYLLTTKCTGCRGTSGKILTLAAAMKLRQK